MIHLPDLLSDQFGISRPAAQRAIAQGAVKLNGLTITDVDVNLSTVPDGDPVGITLGRIGPVWDQSVRGRGGGAS